MNPRVRLAAANNASWCDTVCRSHEIPTATEPHRWFALQRAPDLYPDVVTLQPGVVVDDAMRSVQGGPGCSVKDSFADLELAARGFVELFEAQWLFREPELAPRKGSPAWTVVRNDDDLVHWADAGGLSGTIRSQLLHEQSVRILAAHGSTGVVGGAIANRTSSVIGVSNVFATTVPVTEIWSGLAHTAATAFGPLPLVGYEHGDGLRGAIAAGFTGIGALRVWRRPIPPNYRPRGAIKDGSSAGRVW